MDGKIGEEAANYNRAYPEQQYIANQIAVGFPEILFEFLSDEREIFRSRPGCKGPQRLWPLVGDQLVLQVLPVEGKFRKILVSGYVTPPEEARASSKSFYFFLNQRPINSRLLWKALNQTFRGIMMKNSYPVGALFLEVQPDQVDVNVQLQEMKALFKELISEEVTHCSLGRPVSQVLGFSELERRFGRKR